VEHTTVLRADEPRKDYSRDEVLSNAPEQDGAFFIVPRIV
jgi:aspartyl-tRNA(Asn)/glutamyl-tRNA(Gln) amidotransferase subunit C